MIMMQIFMKAVNENKKLILEHRIVLNLKTNL